MEQTLKQSKEYKSVWLSKTRGMSVGTFLKRYSNIEGRYELVDGTVYAMSGASPLHEWITAEILKQLRIYLDNDVCQAYGSNIFLKTDNKSRRLPDISVICDHSRFNGIVYEGIPRLIVEVTSTNRDIDLYDKKGEYYRLGVREYWIVLSKDEVQVNIWDEKGYIEYLFKSDENGILRVPVHLEDWNLEVILDTNRIPKEILTL
jgi:Uma2 family endonuclease